MSSYQRPSASPLTPTKHQNEAIERGLQHFDAHGKGLLVGACGSGKTLTSIKIAEALYDDPPTKRVLVTVPTRQLVQQAILDWDKNYDPSMKIRFVAVTSDDSVGPGEVTNQQLQQSASNCIVTTNPEDLAEELKRPIPDDEVQVVISTYQSTPRIAEANPYPRDRTIFDLIVCDEAHHLAGGDGSRTFQTVLKDNEISAAARLFLTATPRFTVGRLQTGVGYYGLRHKDEFSMDDKEIFGEIFYELTLAQSIDDPQVPVVGYELVPHYVRKSDLAFAVNQPGNPLNGLNLDHHSHEDTATAAYVLRDLVDNQPDFDVERVLSYHADLGDTKKFRAIWEAMGQNRPTGTRGFKAFHLTGEMDMLERTKKIRDFCAPGTSDISVLANCQALTEGVNVARKVPGQAGKPAHTITPNGLLFAEPKGSPREAMQAIGRVIREGDDSDKVATVIVPLLVDDEDLDNPVLTSRSETRLRRVLLASKMIDAKVAGRIKVPTAPAEPLPTRTFGSSPMERARNQVLYENAEPKVVRLVQEQVAEEREILRPHGRDFTGVLWDKKANMWLARMPNPNYKKTGKGGRKHAWSVAQIASNKRWIELGHFENPEDAAEAVDEFIAQRGLATPMNFGHNPNHHVKRQRRRSRYGTRISYSKKRSEDTGRPNWRPCLRVKETGPDGKQRKVCDIGRYTDNEADGRRIYDALCERYGYDDKIYPDKSVDARFMPNSRAKKIEPGIEEEPYWETYFKSDPDKRYWAYVDTPDAFVVLGYFATVEAARAARERCLEHLEALAMNARWDAHTEALAENARREGLRRTEGILDGAEEGVDVPAPRRHTPSRA